jgi:hypothetical protein
MIIDLAGQRFGHWVVIGFSHTDKKGKACWACRCDCGKEKTVESTSLRRGGSRSCGCSHDEAGNRLRKLITHGQSRSLSRGLKASAEYVCWAAMIQRCENPKADNYERYGGRGVSVDPRWRASFTTFFADMGPKPSPQHSIDRIKNERGYEPDNCRWATDAEQRKNRGKHEHALPPR